MVRCKGGKNNGKAKKAICCHLRFVSACIVIFFGLKYYNSVQEKKETEKAEAETIKATDLTKEEIDEFSYSYNGEDITFQKIDNVWYYKEDTSISIDQDQISNMLDVIAAVTATQEITEPEDISQYGFSKKGEKK